jgi:hypothetical protein
MNPFANILEHFVLKPQVLDPETKLRDMWKPEDHGLAKDFLLTNFSELKG